MEPVHELLGVNWTNPSSQDAVKVQSVEEAQARLTFSLLVPQLGDPDGIYVSDPETIPGDESFVNFVYLSPPTGPFWIIQSAAGPSWKDNFDEQVAECPPPDCESKISVVLIRGGLRALLIDDGASTLLLWREGDVEVRLMGPSSSFTSDVAVETANKL